MSHFSVLAVVPAEELTEDFAASASSSLLQRMLPYCELTDDPAFLIFEPDPDGPDENESGEPGCFFNPNAQWDWYEIGGRWSGELFVPETVPDYLHAEGALREPERSIETICNGLRRVSGARMRDICWDVLRNQTRAELTKSYALWQKVFAGEADPPCTTHLEKTVCSTYPARFCWREANLWKPISPGWAPAKQTAHCRQPLLSWTATGNGTVGRIAASLPPAPLTVSATPGAPNVLRCSMPCSRMTL